MRQRIYNPAQLTPDELKASFVARHETLARMLALLAEQKPGHPCQHIVLVGPRGMGKTTLGLSFLQAVREQEDLSTRWQPVPFPEESYEIADLADFWLAALRHLAQATGEERWSNRADGLQEDERDAERLAAYALGALLDFSEERRKRLILFVENLDLVLSQLGDERDVHALREALMRHAEILLVGSANSVFDAIRSDSQPFYEFFRIVPLPGLAPDECRRLLQAMADQEDGDQRPVALDVADGRLETIRRLTGGNPRFLVLTCRMLRESPLGSAMEDLERLIDEQTPYFKARIEALPAQARKVFHCLAKAWAPLRTREVAAETKLGSSHASAQLRQLIDRGYVREVRQDGETRSRYEVSDRFYNMYYLLRFSPVGRARLERLVDFLHQLYGPIGMRRTDDAAELTNLHNAAIVRQDFAQLRLPDAQEAYARLKPITEGQPGDLPQQRHYQAVALLGAALAGVELGRPEEVTSLLARLPDYIRADDPEDLRCDMTLALAASSSAFCLVGHTEAAEIAARHATRTDAELARGWSALAEALLAQNGRAGLAEAERCARRAVELAPDDNDALVTLHVVLKRRRKRKAAKELLARLPDGQADASERLTRRWTHMLIGLIAKGGAAQVKRLLVDANATDSLEPLWLAARAELGENLGPLPAEIADAVEEVQRMVAEERS